MADKRTCPVCHTGPLNVRVPSTLIAQINGNKQEDMLFEVVKSYDADGVMLQKGRVHSSTKLDALLQALRLYRCL